jgi:hypothetical protein
MTREFVPFDDRWFDREPPGPLVPWRSDLHCVRSEDGTFHWVGADMPEKARTSPSRIPNFAAVPAFNSST